MQFEGSKSLPKHSRSSNSISIPKTDKNAQNSNNMVTSTPPPVRRLNINEANVNGLLPSHGKAEKNLPPKRQETIEEN